jgi:anti-sigma regulatory factor (Ser/Thr protein kinase)
VPDARRAVDAYLEANGVNGTRRDAIRLAVTEACANVVLHAYPADTGTLELDLQMAGERTVVVTVRDQGRGLHPRLDSAGLGLGLPLMAALADTIETVDREPGVGIRMTFDLDGNHRRLGRPRIARPTPS